MITATVSMIIAVILGVPLAWLLARPGLRAASLLRALITIPLVLPPVVGGELSTVLGRSGLLGRPCTNLTGCVSVHPVRRDLGSGLRRVALPRAVGGGCAARSRPLLRGGCRNLGAAGDRLSTDHLALIRPGIAAGAVLAWARASASSVRR